MQISDLQFVYLCIGIVINILTVIGATRHSEKRLSRIETFVMLCCNELKIPTGDLNK